MRRLCSVLLLSVLLLPVLAIAEPGTLVVLAFDKASGRVLAGVRVDVTSRDGRAASATTNADGEARFESLEEGFYRIEASAEGRAVIQEPVFRVIARRATVLELQLPQLELPAPVLEEVMVVARARQADVLNGVSGSFRNREELRNAVGAGADVMRALDGLPGLASDGAFAGFTVRGRGPRNNLIFVDDFPLDKVVHFDQTIGEDDDISGGGRFSIFAPNSVAGAEFSPGGWGAAYGGRSSSLLRLELAEGGLTPVTSLRLDVAGAEFTYDGPSGLSEDTSVFFTARRFDFGRVFELIDQEDIGTPEVTDIILKTTTQLTARDELQFLLIHAPEDYTRDRANVAEDEDFDDTSLISAKQDLSLFGLTWRRLVGSEGEWTNRLYLRSSDKDSTQGEAFPDLVPPGADPADIPVRDGIFTILEDERELGWRSDFSTYNRLGEFSAGLRVVDIDADFETQLDGPWIRYVYESDDPRPPGQQYIVWLPEIIESSLSERGTNVAAYAEQVIEAGRFEVRPGLRVDRDAFSDDTYVAPRLAVSYAASPDLRLSVTSGLYYESPRFLVRAANPDNFDLANEQLGHLGLGLNYDFNESWSLLIEGYYQNLDDLVVDQSRASGRAVNGCEGSSHGIDIVVQRAFSKGWSADFTYSWNDSTRDDNDGSGSYTPDYAREHFASVGARWEISDRLQVAGRWKWGSGRPGDRFIIHEDVLPPALGLTRAAQEITAVNATTLGDYQSLNLRVDYRRRFFGTDLVLFLDVINVYAADRGSPEAFNPISGALIDEDASPFPQFGLILERAW